MNTDTSWLHALMAGMSREVVVEAAYYAVRELKQASIPVLSRKEHLVDASASEPSPEAVALAGRIIEAILVRESASIGEVPNRKLLSYVAPLMGVVHDVSVEQGTLDPTEGRALLERLRAS